MRSDKVLYTKSTRARPYVFTILNVFEYLLAQGILATPLTEDPSAPRNHQIEVSKISASLPPWFQNKTILKKGSPPPSTASPNRTHLAINTSRQTAPQPTASSSSPASTDSSPQSPSRSGRFARPKGTSREEAPRSVCGGRALRVWGTFLRGGKGGGF